MSTGEPVTIVPPSSVSNEARAVVMAAEPPSGTGQPCRWPAAVSMTPTEAVNGRDSGLNTWAAEPANRARAWGVLKRRASTEAGRAARSPNRAIPTGWSGQRTTGPRTSSARVSKPLTSGPNTPRQAFASGPSPAHVSSSERTITPAEPSSSGWARSTSG